MEKIPDIEEGEEPQVELSLGLSIGGSLPKNRTVSIDRSSSNRSPTVDGFGSNGAGFEIDLVDRRSRREIHLLRRKEAGKTREEKKSLCLSGVSVDSHDRMVMEDQELQCRARDRRKREDEACRSEPRKGGEDGEQDVSLSLNPNQTSNPNQNPNLNLGRHQASGISAMPQAPFHFPFHPMQYLAAQPAMVSSASAAGGNFLSSASRGFRPFCAVRDDRNADRPGARDVEQSSGGGGGGGGGGLVLNSSPGSSSSAVSDNGSAGWLQGGNISSDTRSLSTRSLLVQTRPQVSPVCNRKMQLEHSSSIHLKESSQTVEEATEKMESITSQSSPTKPEPTPLANDNAESGMSKPNEPIAKDKSTSMTPLPPKMGDHPEDENLKPLPPSLHYMPCVSTTGNGPNGKTIIGFLHRYAKAAEISIVCVCHGISFSPAEFVKHAGGTDMSHPLRHIVLVPSALG